MTTIQTPAWATRIATYMGRQASKQYIGSDMMHSDMGEVLSLVDTLKERVNALEAERKTHCACIFEGDVNTEQCKLHGAWCDTLHEQADYRRERDEYRLAADTMAASHKVERDALAKDAERYLWLRDMNSDSSSGTYVGDETDALPEDVTWVGSDLDAYVDAAMAQGGKK